MECSGNTVTQTYYIENSVLNFWEIKLYSIKRIDIVAYLETTAQASASPKAGHFALLLVEPVKWRGVAAVALERTAIAAGGTVAAVVIVVIVVVVIVAGGPLEILFSQKMRRAPATEIRQMWA